MLFKIITRTIFFLIFIVPAGLDAQTMFIQPKAETQSSYPLYKIMKMNFSNGNLIITKSFGTPDTFALKKIQCIFFKDLMTDIKNLESPELKDVLNLYPNPANDVLNIQLDFSESQNSVLEILSFEGRIVYLQVLSGSENIHQINISTLAQGIYLCRINGKTKTETIKFIKN